MGYTIKQKIAICLKAESDPNMTQADLANWAKEEFGSSKAPSQTTISRILGDKNDYIASKDTDFQVVRRRKQLNPMLRRILTEWITQTVWENIPITTPIIQLTALAIWKMLPMSEKDGNGMFNQKWCNHFVRKLNINIRGDDADIRDNPSHYPLNKAWKLDEKYDLKIYLRDLIGKENYRAKDIFIIDEFQLFYSLPLDQIFDVSSIDKGLKQSSCSTENSLSIMLGTNIDGSEKLTPLIVGKYDKFDVRESSHPSLSNLTFENTSTHTLMNKITETYNIFYKSNINKWITSSMFQNYLLTLDHKLSNSTGNRKILVILDDSSSHRIINVKFKNIRICYLKNNTDHDIPTNSLRNGVNFDYLPTNFGIVEEFKILYRLQQYLAMIIKERGNSLPENWRESIPKKNPFDIDIFNLEALAPDQNIDILSESDYDIPLIKAIEWIKNAWDSVSKERIFDSWKKSYLFNFNKAWPSSDVQVCNQESSNLRSMLHSLSDFDALKSYSKLYKIMGYLNTVIPWNIDELLTLVNERGKVTLSYISIEEMISSCFLEAYNPENRKGSLSFGSLINTNSDWLAQANFNILHNRSLEKPYDHTLNSKLKSLRSGSSETVNFFVNNDIDFSQPSNHSSISSRYLDQSADNNDQFQSVISDCSRMEKEYNLGLQGEENLHDDMKQNSTAGQYMEGIETFNTTENTQDFVQTRVDEALEEFPVPNKRRQLYSTSLIRGENVPIPLDENPSLNLNLENDPTSIVHLNELDEANGNFFATDNFDANAPNNLEIEFVTNLSRVLEMSATNKILSLSDDTTKELKERLFQMKKKLGLNKF